MSATMSDRGSSSTAADRPEREPKRRTKTGCLTCRKRRVRCDEVHPMCSACTRLKLDCVYPAPQPHLPHDLGRPPQTMDRPRPGRPRLSDKQAADRAKNQRPRVSSATPSRDRNRQNEGEPEDIEMGDSEAIKFSNLAKSKGKRGSMADTSASPNNTPESNFWFFSSTNRAVLQDSTPYNGTLTSTNTPHSHIGAANVTHTSSRESEDTNQNGHFASASTLRNTIESILDDSNGTPSQRLKDENKSRAYDPLAGQHFDALAQRFCPVRHKSRDNMYAYILEDLGRWNDCLYTAMMAWSNLSLALLKEPLRTLHDAETEYEYAINLLEEDTRKGTHIDVILATMWFLVEYARMLADGVDQIRKLLEHAADAIEAEIGNGDRNTALSRIGPVGSMVLVWMSGIECQTAHFGSAGRILGQLQMYPQITQAVENCALTENLKLSHDWSTTRVEQTDEVKQLQKCMGLHLRTILITGQIVLLGRWQAIKDTHTWTPVNNGLELLEREGEEDQSPAAVDALTIAKGDGHVPGPLSPLGLNRLLLLASYYAAIILYQQHGPQNISSADLAPITEACAARIIRIATRFRNEGYPHKLPPAPLMNALFIAGTAVRDHVYQAHVLTLFRESEEWGKNFMKARKLLEHIMERQNRIGVRLDFVKVMEETEGYFII